MKTKDIKQILGLIVEDAVFVKNKQVRSRKGAFTYDMCSGILIGYKYAIELIAPLVTPDMPEGTKIRIDKKGNVTR